ncbi:MAG: TonB C-terminal domain-containing protein [Polyangiales bacterium]
MIVEVSDWRPPSLLGTPRLRAGGWIAGLVVTLLIHVALPWAGRWLIDWLTAQALLQRPEPVEAPAKVVVAARFVRLGKPLDPTQLPNREVPRLSTAPPDQVVVSKDPQDTPPPDSEAPPPDAQEDLVRRLGDRAQMFAEIAEARDREGDPMGIADGTARNAREGDLYAGRLYQFFRRHWTVPTTISDDERRELTCEVDVTIGLDLQIRRFDVRRSSGNPLFDRSVQDAIAYLQRQRSPIPPPPEELAAEYLGKTLRLRFRGRDAS